MNFIKIKKKQKKSLLKAIINIKSSFNNTIISVSDLDGNVLFWSSGGVIGLKGTKKKTAFAAQNAMKFLIPKLIELGVKEVDIVLKGQGNGRDLPLNIIKIAGLNIMSVVDKTSEPFNGCRASKKRRI